MKILLRRNLLSLLVLILCFSGAVAQGQSYSDNVVILLDGSGSMSEKMGQSTTKRIDAAKTAIKKVLKTIPQEVNVGVLVFSGKYTEKWIYPLGARDDELLNSAVDKILPAGGTPLGEFMKIAADRLLEEREAQFGYGAFRLLVVTDGEATSASLVRRYTPEILSRGIIVDVIGVDMKQDHTLAQQANSYRRADDAAALERAISEVFAEVSEEGDNAMSNEDFSLLEGIPVETANAMVLALAKPLDNTPIQGKEKKPAPKLKQKSVSAPVAKAPAPEKAKGFTADTFIWILLILGVIIAVIRGVSKYAK